MYFLFISNNHTFKEHVKEKKKLIFWLYKVFFDKSIDNGMTI